MFLQHFLNRVYAIHALIEALSAGRTPSNAVVKKAGLEGIDPNALRLPTDRTRCEHQLQRDDTITEPVVMAGSAAASVAPWAAMPGLSRAVSF